MLMCPYLENLLLADASSVRVHLRQVLAFGRSLPHLLLEVLKLLKWLALHGSAASLR
jgi:hypothetical protein